MSESVQSYNLFGTDISYILRKHPRARRTSLTIYPDGKVTVTIPTFATILAATRLLNTKKEWLKRNLSKIANRNDVFLPKLNKKERANARIYIVTRVEYFKSVHGFVCNRIYVRDQKRQWGSCSAKKNLNFNYRLALLPQHLCDYVIVHELCHLKELNHSKRFWDLVGSIMPEYKKLDTELKRYIIS